MFDLQRLFESTLIIWYGYDISNFALLLEVSGFLIMDRLTRFDRNNSPSRQFVKRFLQLVRQNVSLSDKITRIRICP